MNARSNVFLDVLKSYFNLSEDSLFNEINGAHDDLLNVLNKKNIQYSDLKNALIPQPKKKEAFFIFDSEKTNTGFYGYEIFAELLPLLKKKSNHSVLCGDYGHPHASQQLLKKVLLEQIEAENQIDYKHSSQFFIIYINNLTQQMLTTIRDGLKKYPPYMGSIDGGALTTFKKISTTILVNCFLKCKENIFMAAESGNNDDCNVLGYPFEEYGYKCKCFPDYLYHMFLSYKIERPPLDGETDTLFGLNAISPSIIPLDDITVKLKPDRLNYLLKEKNGSLKKANLLNLSHDVLAERIKEKIKTNYIYNLEQNHTYNTLKFAILIDFDPQKSSSKILIPFIYRPSKKEIEILSIY